MTSAFGTVKSGKMQTKRSRKMPMAMSEFIGKICRLLPYLLDGNILKAIFRWPRFSLTAYHLVASISGSGIRPATVIDVGANTGQFTIAAAYLFRNPKIYAFEPIPDCVEKLRILASGSSNIEVQATAVGVRNDHVDFYVNAYDQASSLLKLDAVSKRHFGNFMERETIRVPVTTLDRFFKNKAMKKPVLLKIDVQGAEKDVVEGARKTLKMVDYVLLETSFSPMYIGQPSFVEMIETMKASGFTFIRPVDFLKSPKNGEILQADLLFKRAGI
jgi:FkbM family methyltransferase